MGAIGFWRHEVQKPLITSKRFEQLDCLLFGHLHHPPSSSRAALILWILLIIALRLLGLLGLPVILFILGILRSLGLLFLRVFVIRLLAVL